MSIEVPRQQNKYFALEHLPVGICITDDQYRILFWNLRLEKWSGVAKSEISGRLLTEVYPHFAEKKYATRLEQVLNSGPAALFSSQLHPHMFPIALPDGTFRVQNTTLNLIRDDEGRAQLMFTIQDVTETVRHLSRIKDLRRQALAEIQEKEKAQSALQRSEERYRSIFENSPLGILQFDNEGVVVSANKVLRGIFKLEELVGSAIVDVLPPDVLKKAQEAFLGGVTHFHGEVYLPNASSRVFLEINFASIKTQDGHNLGVVGVFEDVSDRVETQRRLRRNQELLSSINRNIKDAIYRSSKDEGLIYVNEAFASIFRFNDIVDARAETIRERFVDQELHDLFEKKVQMQGSIENEEVLLCRKDETRFWALLSVVATRNPDSGKIYYDGAFTDINDRKLDNERIKESEAQYRNLFQNSRVGMYRCDISSGRIVKANKKALEIFGFSSDDQIFSHSLFMNPLNWKRVYWLLIKEGEFENMEFKVANKQGETIWISLSAKYFPEESFFEGVIFDITERKWSETLQKLLYRIADKTSAVISFVRYLEEITQILSEVIDTQNLVIAEVDETRRESRLIYVRDRFIEPGNQKWHNPSVVDFVMDQQDIILQNRDDLDALEKNGEIQPSRHEIHSLLGAPLRTLTSILGSIVIVSYDPYVQFSTKDAEVLRFAAQHLTTAFERKRNEESMVKAIEVAEMASKTKSQFLASMSHELRTPLNSIIGFNRRILKKSADQLDDSSKKALEIIRRNAESLLAMINDVLDLAKVEAGKFSFEICSLNINILIRQTVDELEPLATQKSIDLHFEEVSLPHVFADFNRLKQVMTNLVGNAIKFTLEGSVRISLALEREGQVKISVADTGVGIPEEKLSSIFNVFEQANAQRDQAIGGTGLGLAISRRLMEEMKGSIEVESKVGEGSVFHVFLPCED